MGFETEDGLEPNEAQKLVAYVMPDRGAKGAPGHKFMVVRRTVKNHKGRYVTGEEIAKFGLFWPNSLVKTRKDLATRIGEVLLDEAGVFDSARHFYVTCDHETTARVGATGTFQVIALTEDGQDMTYLVDQGIHFPSLDVLRSYLERTIGDVIVLEETKDMPPPRTLSGESTIAWDQDSEWYSVGLQRGPEGAVFADKAIAARSTSRDEAFAWAKRALEANRAAWSAWYSAFTGIPVT